MVSRRDVERLHADLAEPLLHGIGDKFGAIVRPDMCRRAPCDEQVRQCGEHIFMFELTSNNQRQALPTGLVDDGQDAELATIMRAAFDEVVRPHMPRIFPTQSDARAVVQPQPAALWLALRTLSPSRRQIRSPRLWFTVQPAWQSNAVTPR